MANDQLRLDVSVSGAQDALNLLDQLDARIRGLPAAAQAAGAGTTQAASQITAAWQQTGAASTAAATQTTAAAAQQVAAADRIAAADQKLRDGATALSAEFTRQAQAAEQAAARQVAAAQRKAEAEEQAAARQAAAQRQLVGRGEVIIGGALAAEATALTVALDKSVQEAATFERTFTDVGIVSQATGEQMAAFQEKAIALGVATQFSSQQVAQGFYELSSAGLNVRESMAAIEPAIRAATLGHQQLGQATLTTASIMRQFGMASEDIPKIVDIQTVAVRNSLLHWGELDEAFRGVQGSARFMGISLEETTAALEIQRNAGSSAAMAGTSFRTMLDRISKQSGEAGQAIRDLNLRVFDQAGAFVGLLPLMRQIEEATAGMTERERDREIAMLAGARASGFIKDTLNATKEVERDGQTVTLHGVEVLQLFADQNYAAAGASEEAANAIKNTLDYQMHVLTASVQEAAIRLGTQFLPAVKEVATGVTGLVNSFVQAPPALQASVAVVAAVGAAALATSGAVLGLAGAAVFLGPAIAAAAVAAAPFLAAVAAIAAASAALGVAWVNDWGGIREATADAATRVQTDMAGIGAAAQTLGTQMHAASLEVGALFDALGRTPEGQALGGLVTQAQALGLNWGEAFKTGARLALGPAATLALGLDQWLHSEGVKAQAAAAEEGKRVGADFTANVAAAVIATAPQGADALAAVTAQLRAEFLGRDATMAPEKVDEAVQLYVDQVRAAVIAKRPDLTEDGKQIGTAVGVGLEAAAPAVQSAAERIAGEVGAALQAAKGNVDKAVTELLNAENRLGHGIDSPDVQAGVQGILERANAYKALEAVLGTLTPAERAHYETELLAAGSDDKANASLRILQEMLAAGRITQEEFTNAVERGSVGLERHAAAQHAAQTALQAHTAVVHEWLGSTDPAIVAAGQWAQQVDAFIQKTAQAVPALSAQIVALRNAGQEEQALTLIAQAEGVTRDALTAKIQTETGARGHSAAAIVTEASALQQITGSRADQVYTALARQLPAATAAHYDMIKSTQGVDAALHELSTAGLLDLTAFGKGVAGTTTDFEHYMERFRAAAKGTKEAAFVPFQITGTVGTPNTATGPGAQAGTQVQADLTGQVPAVHTAATHVGAAVHEGLATGITAGHPAVGEATRALVQHSVTTAREHLRIRSPSGVFADEVGAPIPEGIAAGITEHADEVTTALGMLTAQAAALEPQFAERARQAGARVAPGIAAGLSYEEIQGAVDLLGTETVHGLVGAMNAASGAARDTAREMLRLAVADQQAAIADAAAQADAARMAEAEAALRAGFALLRASLDETQAAADQQGTATGAAYVEAVATRVEAGQPVLSQTFQAAIQTDPSGAAAQAAGQEVGGNLITGIVQGVQNAADQLRDALTQVARDALAAVKAALGIASPSRLFADQVGRPIMQGVAEGMAAGAPEAQKALVDALSPESTAIVIAERQAAQHARTLVAPAERTQWDKTLDLGVMGSGPDKFGDEKAAEQFKALDQSLEAMGGTLDKLTLPFEKVKSAIDDIGQSLDTLGPSTDQYVEDVARMIGPGGGIIGRGVTIGTGPTFLEQLFPDLQEQGPAEQAAAAVADVQQAVRQRQPAVALDLTRAMQLPAPTTPPPSGAPPPGGGAALQTVAAQAIQATRQGGGQVQYTPAGSGYSASGLNPGGNATLAAYLAAHPPSPSHPENSGALAVRPEEAALSAGAEPGSVGAMATIIAQNGRIMTEAMREALGTLEQSIANERTKTLDALSHVGQTVAQRETARTGVPTAGTNLDDSVTRLSRQALTQVEASMDLMRVSNLEYVAQIQGPVAALGTLGRSIDTHLTETQALSAATAGLTSATGGASQAFLDHQALMNEWFGKASALGEGMDFAGAAAARAGLAMVQQGGDAQQAALAAQAATEQWKLVGANAAALMAGQMRNAGVAGGVTAKGLTSSEIYGPTATYSPQSIYSPPGVSTPGPQTVNVNIYNPTFQNADARNLLGAQQAFTHAVRGR